MAEKISTGQGETAHDVLRRLEALLGELRAIASAPANEPKSWREKAIERSAASKRQHELNVALVRALNEVMNCLRATADDQDQDQETETRLERLEARPVPENLDTFRERFDRLETELRSAAANVRALQERAAAVETALAQSRDEQAERVQHLLDEQRICIRQLALQASEEAVLADRARRATELKLEELARRLPPPPA